MRRFLFWAGLLAAIALIAAAALTTTTRGTASGALRPFLAAKAAVANAIAANLTSVERIQLANSKRVEQNLRAQLAAARAVMAENAELRAYFRLAPPKKWRVTVAPVIARDPVTWNRRFRIGKGAADGLRPGAAVLSGNQLVGRIAELTRHTALVVTIADSSCRLGVMVGPANAPGILQGRVSQKWQAPPVCLVTYLPRNATFRPNDAVVTSGLGGTMPAGIPVGRLVPWEGENGTAVRIADEAYAEVLLRPGADFGVTRFVGVVIAPAATAETIPPDDTGDAAQE